MANLVQAHRRAKPGSKGGGRFFHIELRPSAQFVRFRVQKFGGRVALNA
jgi:hypothetical protein